MDIIHVYTKFEDQFSGSITEKITTHSIETFQKMKKGIGTYFSYFDKKQGIKYNYKVLEVRQVINLDYKNATN